MRYLALFGLAALLTFFYGCDVADTNDSVINSESQRVGNTTDTSAQTGNPSNNSTIVDIAVESDDFNILTEAVIFAGLDGTLSGNRRFTVFAPTDEAFEALLAELGLTAEELLTDDNKDLVTDILLYHVAPGNRESESVVSSSQIRTLQRSFIKVKSENGDFFVGNEERFAQLIDVDIFARNGVIHVIDTVMLPPENFNPGNSRGRARR